MPRYYLGLDGGQSSTKALISDESGAVLGRAVDGPCNHVSAPEAIEKFRRVIGGCVAACRKAAQLPESVVFEAVCCGFSGGPHDKERLARELIRGDRFYITHDAEIALAGALAGEAGIIVISGTGSIAFGRNAAGKTARTGGWGYVLGDEGGAFDLARRAVRAALRFEEGWGPKTALHGALLAATASATAQDLMHALYTPDWPRSRAAHLAALVTAAADAGDAIALEILDAAAAQLAGYAAGVHSQLFSEPAPVSPVGGTFASPVYRKAFDRAIRALLQCDTLSPRSDPAGGALLLARRL